jgi:hypothetical protein
VAREPKDGGVVIDKLLSHIRCREMKIREKGEKSLERHEATSRRCSRPIVAKCNKIFRCQSRQDCPHRSLQSGIRNRELRVAFCIPAKV